MMSDIDRPASSESDEGHAATAGRSGTPRCAERFVASRIPVTASRYGPSGRHLASIASVDLTTTSTSSPSATSRSSSASLVMTDVIALAVGEPRAHGRDDVAVADLARRWRGAGCGRSGATAIAAGGAPDRRSSCSSPSRKRRTARALSRRQRSTASPARRGDQRLEDIGANCPRWASTSASLRIPARSRRASFSSSSERTSRRWSTGRRATRRAAWRPAAVARSSERSRPRPGAVPRRATRRRSTSWSIARYVSGRDSVQIRPRSPVGGEQRTDRPAVLDPFADERRDRRARRAECRRRGSSMNCNAMRSHSLSMRF